MFHSRALLISVFAMALPLVSACGNAGSSGTNGEGGEAGCEPNCGQGGDDNPATDTTTVGPGQGGSTPTTTGGGTCTPTPNDPTCAGAESCSCGDFEFGAPPGDCPDNMGNTCSPGHNQCGCDLPLGQDYLPPDDYCSGFVNGDRWQTSEGFEDSVGSHYTSNGQFMVGFRSLFGADESYFEGFIMTGRKFYWNMSNDKNCEGEINESCEEIYLICYTEGQSATAYENTLYHLSQ